MAVYVDPMMEYGTNKNWPYKEACHMVADTLEELHDMARKIGVRYKWFQRSPPHRTPHYDLTNYMRFRAVQHGAIDLDKDTTHKDWNDYRDVLYYWTLKAINFKNGGKRGKAIRIKGS